MAWTDALGFTPTQFYRRYDPPPPPDTRPRDVAGYTRRITSTYETKGAAHAAAELANAAQDASLTADQRKELLTGLRPVIDKIAEDLGRNARRSDLPESGQAERTAGIDDRQEYKTALADLALAVQQGDAPEAQRIAERILHHTPGSSASGVDNLGLLGDGLRDLGVRSPMLREAVVSRLNLDAPQSAPPGTELSLPKETRTAAAKTLVPVVAGPYDVPNGNDPVALRAYTDWAQKQAVESEKAANELKAPFDKGKKPEDDPVGWEMYMTRYAAAKTDRARYEQAMGAELRTTYGGDPKNKAATERLARQIGARYGGEDAANLAASALKGVLGETAAQRTTNSRLYDAHRADDKLNSLVMDQQAGKDVPDHAIDSARNEYASAREALLRAAGAELNEEIPRVTDAYGRVDGRTIVADPYERADPRVLAADRIGARHANDPEFQAALNAEVILRKAGDAAGPEQQMKTLAELMPRSLDPTTRALVLSDARGSGIVDRYIDWGASEVTGAYDSAAAYYDGYQRASDYHQRLFQGTPPALAATQRLRELTDPHANSFMKPDMLARLFNELRTGENGKPSTMDRILSDVALDGEWHRVLLDKDNPYPGSIYPANPTYDAVIKNLSFSMEHLGRARDRQTGEYPPAIDAEISWVARRFAELAPMLREPIGTDYMSGLPPYESRLDGAFKQAASEGSVILALETARQLTRPGATFEEMPYPEWDRHAQANLTVKFVRAGIDDFRGNTADLFHTVNKNMAPVSSPIARFGVTMTEEQTRSAVASIYENSHNGQKLYQQMLKDREAIDVRGYDLVRLGETVGFYEHSLDHLKEYGGVIEARSALLDSKESTSMILLSNSAALTIGAATAMNMLGSHRGNGHLMPQKYSWIAQSADFTEYWAETYVLQQRGQGVQPGSAEYGTWGDPGKRHPAFSMPKDVAGPETIYNPGEGRAGMTPNGHGGTYVRNLQPAAVEINNYAATRLGRFPLAGAAVWGGGGYMQVKLWDYIHNEVGFDKSEQWRKPFLEGVVGGFAAFHLLEAGVALARVPPEAWRGMKNAGWLESFQSKAPLLYQSFDNAFDRNQAWTRFSLSGTKGLTGSLAGLMGIAAVWDISGVAYRAGDGHVEHQGLWGSKWWKVGTHGVNAVSDVLLLRLQLREFSKRAVPGLIQAGMADGALAKGATSLSASRALSWVGSRALTANPIGVWVNVAYALTTGVNWIVDQNRHIKDLEHYDNVFLKGAGVNDPQAQLLREHAFWTGDGKGDGFALGYQAVGGDPSRFVNYLNSQDPGKLAAAIEASGDLPDHVQPPESQPQLPFATEYYLSLPPELPSGPGATDSRIAFNEQTGRHEDPFTQMYFDQGKWIYYGAKDAGPGAAELVSYDPRAREVTKSDGASTRAEQIAIAGLKQSDPHAAYLALPDGNPSHMSLSNFPTVHFNSDKRRYEDSATGLYYDGEMKAWRREDNLGDMGFYYYPNEQKSVYYWPRGHQVTDRGPTGAEGWRAYLKAHDMLPPVA